MGARQCCLSVVVSVFSHLIGFFLAMQYHSKINTGVHSFVSFAVTIVLFKCMFILIIEPCIVQYDIYFSLFILQGGTVMTHMIHPTLFKAQFVVQRVHSTSPHHMIKSGSDLNPTAINKTVVLLLVMSFTRTQVGSALQLIIILLPLINLYS